MSKKQRYTKEEHFRIKYYKLKIREIPYLEHEIEMNTHRLKSISNKLESYPSHLYLRIDKDNKDNIESRINDLLDKKFELLKQNTFLKEEIKKAYNLLDELSEFSRNIAIDLLINEIGVENIKSKYSVANPYQIINDELKDIVKH